MEKNFDNKEFEQFLKQNADQYRMYPSEKVWNGIYSSLHSRKRWLGIGLILLFLAAATVTMVMNYSPSATKQVADKIVESPNTTVKKEFKPVAEILNPALHPLKQTNSVIPDKHHSVVTNSFIHKGNNPTDIADAIIPNYISDVKALRSDESEVNNEDVTLVKAPAAELVAAPVEEILNPVTGLPISIDISDPANDNNPDLTDVLSSINSNKETTINKTTRKDIYPLSIESVLNLYKAPLRKNISIQAYFTPTISFRKLSQNNSFLNSAAMNNPSTTIAPSYDVNQAVTHKPGLGFEFGVSARYPISKNIKIKGGLQTNINRYDIKAFSYPGEVATIALNQGTGINSLYTWSKYRNFAGNTSNWLQNYYFSISAPVGAEINFAKNNKVSLSVAGSIQPTYIVHDRAYLITTDYKNYAEIPWLIRRWNVNTSMEVFVNYTAGKVIWQVGPQIRYQLLSSFQNKYPFKENLYNYGLKLGIMLKK